MKHTIKNKTITVIIAAFRAEFYIKETVKSILSQTLPDGWRLQLIVGVDGCKQTKLALNKLKDSRLHKYMMTKNMGTYTTFNTMMRYAEGDIILRFDADDVMYEGMLSAGIEEVLKGRGLIQFKCKEFPKSSYVRIPHGILMFTRETWNKVGGFQPWRCGADTYFIQAALYFSCSRKILDNKVYFGVRKGPNTLTSSKKTGFGSPYRKKIQSQVHKGHNSKVSYQGVPLGARCVKI